MKNREITLLLGFGCLVVCLVALFGLGGNAGGEALNFAPEDETVAEAGQEVPVEQAEAPVAMTADAVEPGREEVDTSTWTSGIIYGDIKLNPRAVPDLHSITVTVIEARNMQGETAGGGSAESRPAARRLLTD